MKAIVSMVVDKINEGYIVIPKAAEIPKSASYTKQAFLGIVLKFVSEELNISEDRIMGGSRKYPGPHARQLYFHLCDLYKPKDIDDTEVGQFINKSRSMAISAPKIIRRIAEVDKKYNAQLQEIEQRFKQKISI